MSEESVNKMKERIKEIVESNGISDAISSIEIQDAGLQGEGFTSVTTYVTVKFQNENVKPLHLFVKALTSKASHREYVEGLKAFEKEAVFLGDYVKAAETMCRSKGFEGFLDFYPKCYFGDEKTLVLENLVEKGYKLMDKEIQEDFEAASLAMITLAKHHAIAHVMIQESGGAKPFFQKFPDLDYEVYDKPDLATINAQAFTSSLNSNLKILEKSSLKEASNIAEKLKRHMNNANEKVLNALKVKNDDKLLVLGHGDYRNHNMMFLKDKTTQKMVHHVAIDFQITRYNTPSLDLCYYMYKSLGMKLRRKHLKELLEIYLKTLNQVSTDFGHAINLSFEELFLEFRKKFVFGFWLGFTVSIGPGLTLMQQVAMSNADKKDWMDLFDQLMNQWIDQNPDRIDAIAEEIGQVLEEYEELLLEDESIYVK